MQDLIQFGETTYAPVKSVHPKTGAETTRLLRPKEFKAEYIKTNKDASNREIKRAYEAYYKVASKANTARLAAELTSGKLGAESASISQDGDKLRVTFVDLSTIPTTTQEAKELIDGAKDPKDLEAILKMVQEKLAATQKPIEQPKK